MSDASPDANGVLAIHCSGMVTRRSAHLIHFSLAVLGFITALVVLTLASPAPALAADVTELRAAVAPQVVDYPGTAVIAGVLSFPGGTVALLERPAGATEWSPADSVTVGADGAFRFELAPSSSTDLLLTYDGDAQHAPASLALRVGVRPHVVLSSAKSLWLGRSVRLRGLVAPACPGAPVLIERRVAGVWQPFQSTTLDDDSRFAFRWHPDDFGFFRLRARLAADDRFEESASGARVITVNRPNRHRVPYRFAHYIVIVRHRYRLYYYEHGKLVRDFAVALGRPGYRTPLGHYRIWAKRRPAGGALGSCAMFYRGSIAIHGTNQPYLLRRFPRNFSHGCARMYNDEALWLYLHCPRGTPVHNLR